MIISSNPARRHGTPCSGQKAAGLRRCGDVRSAKYRQILWVGSGVRMVIIEALQTGFRGGVYGTRSTLTWLLLLSLCVPEDIRANLKERAYYQGPRIDPVVL